MANDLEKQYAEQIKNSGIGQTNLGRFGGVARSPQATAKPLKSEFESMNLLQKVQAVGSQTLQAGGELAKKTGSYVVNTAKDIASQGYLAASSIADMRGRELQSRMYSEASRRLGEKQDEVIRAYKSGKLSKENYLKALAGFSESFKQLSHENEQLSDGPTPLQRGAAIAETGVNVLSLGRYQLAKAVVKGGAKQIVKVGAKDALQEGSTKLEKLIATVPAVRGLIERNAASLAKREGQRLAGETTAQYISREGKRVAAGLLIKRPIFYELNIGGAQDAYNQVMSGDYDDALKTSAWLGTQMLNGGPLGAAFKGFSWLKNTAGKLAYGKQSFIDEVSRQIGNKNPTQIARFLETMRQKAPEELKEAEKTFRILQETNLRSANENAKIAAENVLQHYIQHGYNLADVTPSQLYKDMRNWAQADELAQRTLRSGLVRGVSPEDAGKYAVVRWDQTAKEGLANAVSKAGNHQEMIDAVYKLADQPGVGWGNNPILIKRIEQAIVQSKNADEAADAIRGITAASAQLDTLPKKVADQLSKLGYTVAAPFGGRLTPVVGPQDTRKLVTAAIKGDNKVFDLASSPNPVMATLARGLERAGISPRAANEIATRRLSENLVGALDELGMGAKMGLKNTQGGDVVNGGRAILSILQRYVENKKPLLGLGKASAVTDIRMLSPREVAEALNITTDQAKTVQRAITDAYLKVPLEFRGLGDKIVDGLYRINPLHKYYARAQSALRYTYNPFFRTQERVETEVLSKMQANELIWNRSKAELNEGARILDEAGIFTSSFSGEGAADQVLGRITANLTLGQKRQLAGLAYNIADAKGVSLQKLALENPQEIDDALRVIVQYPKKGILASNLARTMNVAFFPMRYNTKVTMLAAQKLAEQPPAIQLAFINSLFKMRDWLKSDEGIAWQSEHADAIQVLKWLTPVGSIEYGLNLLTHKPDSLGQLGSLGGLPLGVITQMLDSQGIINLNTPYVQPKTGDVIPKYIPETTQARAAVAVGDLLGSMFTYPGRILGLPGKESTIRDVVRAFIDTNGSDFEKRLQEDRLTPLQRNWVRVLKGDTSKEAVDALYNSPAPGQFKGYTLPPLDLPLAPPTTPIKPVEKRTGLPSGKSGKREKNYAIPPQL